MKIRALFVRAALITLLLALLFAVGLAVRVSGEMATRRPAGASLVPLVIFPIVAAPAFVLGL